MAGGHSRPALDLQLKATTTLAEPQSGTLHFRLPVKNYNDLCVETQTPRLLVLLELPEDEERWMTVTDEELILPKGVLAEPTTTSRRIRKPGDRHGSHPDRQRP